MQWLWCHQSHTHTHTHVILSRFFAVVNLNMGYSIRDEGSRSRSDTFGSQGRRLRDGKNRPGWRRCLGMSWSFHWMVDGRHVYSEATRGIYPQAVSACLLLRWVLVWHQLITWSHAKCKETHIEATQPAQTPGLARCSKVCRPDTPQLDWTLAKYFSIEQCSKSLSHSTILVGL